MDFITKTLSETLYDIGFLPVLMIIVLLGLLIFWFEAKQVKKDSNSIFDQWFLTMFAAIFLGRLGYIIARWDDFAGWYWFWLPYEKYGDEIFLFRAMPWRIFSIWDGGFLIIAMFVVYIISAYLYVVLFKRWRWKEMLVVVLVPANFMMAGFLFTYGIFIQSDKVAQNGMNLLLYTVSFELLITLLKVVYRSAVNQYTRLRHLLTVLFVIGDIFLISYIFLSEQISTIERYNVYAFIIFGIFMLLSYIYDVNRAEPPSKLDDFDGPKHSITLNQAIKVSQDK